MTARIDFHVHTDASHDGRHSLDRLAAAARAAGLDAIAVTDHNLCTPVPPELDGVLLIPGCEVSTSQGHVLGLFLDRPLDLEALRQDGLPTAQAAVEEIHRGGGLAVLAHPYEKRGADPEQQSFRPDGVEAANARACLKVSDANQRAAALAERWSLPALGGSDAHACGELGSAWTELDCDDLSLPALRSAVLDGKCRPVLARQCSHLNKGLSQFARRRRQGGLRNLAVGAAYTVYCGLLDIFRKRH